MERANQAAGRIFNSDLLAGTVFDSSAAGIAESTKSGKAKLRLAPGSGSGQGKRDPIVATSSLQGVGVNARLSTEATAAQRRDATTSGASTETPSLASGLQSQPQRGSTGEAHPDNFQPEASGMALPEPLREPLTAWPSPELEAQQATIEFAAMATGLKADSLTWEFQLFCKLLYRHKNQHRNTLSFRHLLEVRRGIKLLLNLRLEKVVSDFGTLFRTRIVPHRDSTVACGEAGVFLLRTLLAGCRLAESAVGAIRRAASLTSAHLARLHFVRVHMLMLAMLSRLQVLICSMFLQAVRCYNELVGLAGLLPFRKAKPTQIGQELPEMLRCDWVECRPVATTLAFPPNDGILQRSQQHGLRFEVPQASSLQDRARLEAEAAIAACVQPTPAAQKRERQAVPLKSSKQQKRARIQEAGIVVSRPGQPESGSQHLEPQSVLPGTRPEVSEPAKGHNSSGPRTVSKPHVEQQVTALTAKPAAASPPPVVPSAPAAPSSMPLPGEAQKPKVQRAGRGFASMPLVGVAKRPGLSFGAASGPRAPAAQAGYARLAASAVPAVQPQSAPRDLSPALAPGKVSKDLVAASAARSAPAGVSEDGGPGARHPDAAKGAPGVAVAAPSAGVDLDLSKAAFSERQFASSTSEVPEKGSGSKSLPLLGSNKKRKKPAKPKTAEEVQEKPRAPPSWLDLNPW